MAKTVLYGLFEWDEAKERENIRKHGVDFSTAAQAFLDDQRIIAQDEVHSDTEPRMFCIGLVDSKILTVRFAHRKPRIRIIGAGYWRKGKNFYEKEQKK
jgi:uncharacterized DUF497 family protein